MDDIDSSRTIDTYQKIKYIAEGAYGRVFSARDLFTDEVVAIKYHKKKYIIAGQNEINLLKRLNHRNIVSLKAIVMDDMDLCQVMEFGPTCLRNVIQDEEFLLCNYDVKSLTHQLLCGVGYLHDNRIIHRDLKPENIVICVDGCLKICDFGLACVHDPSQPPYSTNVTTLCYSAPEILLGSTSYGPAIDIWSIGCIFAEMLNRVPLFYGRDVGDQVFEIFSILGCPSEIYWPNLLELSLSYTSCERNVEYLEDRFTRPQCQFLLKFLEYDEKKRITCEQALQDNYMLSFYG